MATERNEPELNELWDKFRSLGGSRTDWDSLILKPEWPDDAVSWISTEDENHALKLEQVMSQHLHRGDMVEYVVRNLRGDITGEALGRVDSIKSAKGHYAVKFVHLATTDSNFDDWAREHLNDKEDFDMHFCKKDATSCQIKPFSKKVGFFHVDTFRLMPFWMAVRLGYAQEVVLQELENLITAWGEQEGYGETGGTPPPPAEVAEAEVPALEEAAEDTPVGYGVSPVEGVGARLTLKERNQAKANKAAASKTAPTPPVKKTPPPKGPPAGDREAKSHAVEASRALSKRSPEMIRKSQTEAQPPEKRARTSPAGERKPRVELKSRAEVPAWMLEVGRDDSSVPDGGDDRRRTGGGPPGGGGPGDSGDDHDDKGKKNKKDKEDKKKKKKASSSSSSTPARKVRASHIVPVEKKKKRKKPSDDGDDGSSSGREGKRNKQSKKKEVKKKDDEKKKRKKKKKKDSSGGGGSSGSSSDTDENLYGKDAQKYQSLMQKSRRNPGKLLRKGLEQMSQYLVARVGDSAGW